LLEKGSINQILQGNLALIVHLLTHFVDENGNQLQRFENGSFHQCNGGHRVSSIKAKEDDLFPFSTTTF